MAVDPTSVLKIVPTVDPPSAANAPLVNRQDSFSAVLKRSEPKETKLASARAAGSKSEKPNGTSKPAPASEKRPANADNDSEPTATDLEAESDGEVVDTEIVATEAEDTVQPEPAEVTVEDAAAAVAIILPTPIIDAPVAISLDDLSAVAAIDETIAAPTVAPAATVAESTSGLATWEIVIQAPIAEAVDSTAGQKVAPSAATDVVVPADASTFAVPAPIAEEAKSDTQAEIVTPIAEAEPVDDKPVKVSPLFATRTKPARPSPQLEEPAPRPTLEVPEVAAPTLDSAAETKPSKDLSERESKTEAIDESLTATLLIDTVPTSVVAEITLPTENAEAKSPEQEGVTAAAPAAINEPQPAATSNAAPTATPALADIAAPGRLPPGFVSRRSSETEQARSHEVDTTRFLRRVVGAFHAAEERGTDVRLKLRPPELGEMRLEIQVRDGVVTARMETETSSARSIILDNLPQLRERLAEQGMRIEKFEVNVSDRQPGGMPDPGPQSQGREESPTTPRTPTTRSAKEEPFPRPIRPNSDPAGLNVLV